MNEQPENVNIVQWSESLAGIARTGLAFSENLYERERFEEILKVAAQMRRATETQSEASEDEIVAEWLSSVKEGVPGYVTPKVAVGAVVRRGKEVLLIQRSDSGHWLYPTGWADIGYSPSEVAVKEVAEETGVIVNVVRPIAIFDGFRLRMSRTAFYSLIFLCDYVDGELNRHELETNDIGWFTQDTLPSPLAGGANWTDVVFRAMANDDEPVYFDSPRPEIIAEPTD